MRRDIIMFRDIKFRFWDIKREIMIGTEGHILIDGSGDIWSHIPDPYEPCIEEEIDMIPLQYTGMKDKNDVEIYEGDVITVFRTDSFPKRNRGTVVFNTGVFGFVSTRGWISLHNWDIDSVLGNIHENPELAEESNNDQ